MSSPIILSILIPSHARDLSLGHLLLSLKEFEHRDDCEIIVVQNPELTPELPESFPKIKFLSSERGSNYARTKAYESSRGQWLWYIDDDCSLPASLTPDFIMSLISSSSYDAYAGVYCAGAQMNPLAKAYFIISDLWQHQCFKMGFPMLIGGNCLIKRSALDSQCWPTFIKFGGAELQLNLRAREKGLNIKIEKDLVLIHNIEEQTPKSLREKARLQAGGSHQIQRPQEKKLLFHPLIESLHTTHSLYRSATQDERVQIEKGFEIYKDNFRKQRRRNLLHSSWKVWFSENWKKLKIIVYLQSLEKK